MQFFYDKFRPFLYTNVERWPPFIDIVSQWLFYNNKQPVCNYYLMRGCFKMEKMDDILNCFEPSVSNSEAISKNEIISMIDDSRIELKKSQKKLKKAKKKGKSGKKLKKKMKKLEVKLENLEFMLHSSAACKPIQGRWDGLIKNSVPEVIKLVTAIVDRTKRQQIYPNQRQTIYLPKNHLRYLSKSQQLSLPQDHPIYLPFLEQDDEK